MKVIAAGKRIQCPAYECVGGTVYLQSYLPDGPRVDSEECWVCQGKGVVVSIEQRAEEAA